MNALIYAVNLVHNTIPRELLHAGMMYTEKEATANLTSLDDKLLTKVIRSRVLLDTNIIGGVELIIPITNIQPTFTDYYYTVYHIPPDLIMNRRIISALSISYLPINSTPDQIGGMYGYGGCANPVTATADRVGDAAASSSVLTNANLELVGPNTVLVYANYRAISNFGIRIVIENDSNLSNIQARSYVNLGTLCVLATKSYIYNTLIIPVNMGVLSGGQDLGVFKSILESYSSAEEDYSTYLREVWGSVALMNDSQRYNRYLGSMLSPNI